jgi:hypothetical protein
MYYYYQLPISIRPLDLRDTTALVFFYSKAIQPDVTHIMLMCDVGKNYVTERVRKAMRDKR